MELWQLLILLAVMILSWRLFKLEKRVRKIEDLIDEACDEMEDKNNETQKAEKTQD